jgi:hypothetical protein
MKQRLEKRRGRAVSALLVMLATAGLTSALTATPANAGIHSITVSEFGVFHVPDECLFENWRVGVTGLVRMTGAVDDTEQAQQLINEGHRVRVEGWGDDWFDNKEFGPDFAFLLATPRGILYQLGRCTQSADLNEDPTVGDNDEIYLKITFEHPNGVTLLSTETSRTDTNWGN